MWRLVSHPRIGPDVVAELLVGAVSTWSNDTDWPDAAASFVGVARRLRDVGVIDEDALARGGKRREGMFYAANGMIQHLSGAILGLVLVGWGAAGFDAKRWDLEFEFKNTKGGPEAVEAELSDATPMRAWAIAKAFELGMSVADVPQAECIRRL